MQIPESELILNADGSIYHLNILPEQLAQTVITVGDPDRVEDITKHFDSVDVKVRKREFHTQTGKCNGKSITVISTGIGTDNIDIVFNELDALANIDLNTREIKAEKTALDIIRVGTSGAIQEDIPIDSFLVSELGIGFDTLLHYYDSKHLQHLNLSKSLTQQLELSEEKSHPYIVSADPELLKTLDSTKLIKGITATNVGFYAPQGRVLRAGLSDVNFMQKLKNARLDARKITNLEMETAGIYGMASLLGHRAVSLNAILANRANGEFSKSPKDTVDNLILYTLEKLTH
ncbi:nucleoside phosphorylase [Croceibacter atlanticus]|uniref:nucleoside phosphorylase n=1 Tax=Croceibacter atlanticus TaxID=313588 RepID=UPI002354BC68|nr:nucleoside phosphorylase [Croceibacter atlanticus]|tara:strand:+ start:23821 stop:24690 length:870 start_codon:yes stop_codon:yes gene_type:complete